MQPRFLMNKVNPQGYAAMLGLEKYIASTNIDKKLKELIKILASEINGCEHCIAIHTKDALQVGETQQRIEALAEWKTTSLFTPQEKAVLALTEAITLIAESHVSDAIYDEVRKYFDENATAETIMAIVVINSWNRIAITSRV